jgi:gliding motility-associated-like protein
MIRRIIIFFFLNNLYLNSDAQTLFYTAFNDTTSYIGYYNLKTCKDSFVYDLGTGFTYINGNGYFLAYDLTIAPNGCFYMTCSDFTKCYLIKIDLVNKTSIIITETFCSNSLTCDASGIIYGSSTGLFSYNTITGVYKYHGDLPVNMYASGDLTFQNGHLYQMSENNQIVEVNIQNPMQSTVKALVSAGSNIQFYGVLNYQIDCESSSLLVSGSDSTIYEIDLKSGNSTSLCKLPFVVLDMANPYEDYASTCHINVDLDQNNSSNTTDTTDFRAKSICKNAEKIAIADADLQIYSDFHLDSARVRLFSGNFDGVAEQLALVGITPLSIAGNNSAQMRLISTNNSNTKAQTIAEFKNALSKIIYQNLSATPTPGLRMIETIIFGKEKSDTAFTFIEIGAFSQAGTDMLVSICKETAAFQLKSLLSNNAQTGGVWQPNQAFFSPNTDISTTFLYVFGQNAICPADTAIIKVNVLPQPIFSLGVDQMPCQSQNILLQPTIFPPNSTLIWQNDSTNPTFQTNQTGIFWAEATNTNGCKWRDSIQIFEADTFLVSKKITLCKGQFFTFGNQTITKDTTFCQKFATVNGCDSTICTAISFIEKKSSSSKTICDGQKIVWQGLSLTLSGTYLDTISMPNSCDSIVELVLIVQNSPVFSLGADQTYCQSQTILLQPIVFPPNSTFIWQNGSTNSSFQTNQTGVFWAEATGLNGCKWRDSVQIFEADTSFLLKKISLCKGQTFQLGNQLFENDTLICQIFKGINGCDSTICTKLVFAEKKSLSTKTLCEGQNYAWNGQFLTTSGIYFDTIATIDCDSIAQLNLNFQLSPILKIEGDSFPCFGQTVDLLAKTNEITSFLWSNGSSANSINVNQSGIYSLLATNSAGCSTSKTIKIEFLPEIQLFWESINPDCVNGKKGEIDLSNSSGGLPPFQFSLNGNTFQNSPTFENLEMGQFLIRTKDAQNCEVLDSLELLDASNCEPRVYFPNVFSPNFDGQNDEIGPFGAFVTFKNMKIFDRWGELLFEDFSENPKWDGRFRGKYCENGVYLVFLSFQNSKSDKVEFLTKSITLVR